MSVTLESIRGCLEGVVPSTIATCAPDGTPNVAYLSQVHYVDAAHVALSLQFFNKTRENLLANPFATVQVIDPASAAHFRLHAQYVRTETEGPRFEHMKAKLAGITSHTGMSKIFKLRGSDIYRVHGIECVYGESTPRPDPTPGRLAALRACTRALGECTDLAALLDESLACLARHFGIGHSMLLVFDEKAGRLSTVARCGYAESGAGSKLRLGEGIIGVAARERTAIRIGHMAREYLYSRAMRESFAAGAPASDLKTEIPLPGLPESRKPAHGAGRARQAPARRPVRRKPRRPAFPLRG